MTKEALRIFQPILNMGAFIDAQNRKRAKMNRKTHFDCLILTPFYTFLSLYSFSSFLIVLLLFPTFSSPLLLLLFSHFRPSSALCESISRRAQTPAPHFLPCGTKSSRSSKDSYILYLTYIPQHMGQHFRALSDM